MWNSAVCGWGYSCAPSGSTPPPARGRLSLATRSEPTGGLALPQRVCTPSVLQPGGPVAELRAPGLTVQPCSENAAGRRGHRAWSRPLCSLSHPPATQGSVSCFPRPQIHSWDRRGSVCCSEQPCWPQCHLHTVTGDSSLQPAPSPPLPSLTQGASSAGGPFAGPSWRLAWASRHGAGRGFVAFIFSITTEAFQNAYKRILFFCRGHPTPCSQRNRNNLTSS